MVGVAIDGRVAMADVELWLDELPGRWMSRLRTCPQATQDELLTLTGDIAHNVVRLAVPLSSYLVASTCM